MHNCQSPESRISPKIPMVTFLPTRVLAFFTIFSYFDPFESLISAKKIHEVAVGDRFSVSVSATVKQHDEIKTLKRFFIVEKQENSIRVSKSEMYGDIELVEGNVTRMGRQKLIRVRIRGGKIQRRKKLSAVGGYTTRGGKLVRMSPAERRNRKLVARRSKFKRRAKMRQAIRKRKMSLRKRKAMGL